MVRVTFRKVALLGSTSDQHRINIGSTSDQHRINPGSTSDQPRINIGSTWVGLHGFNISTRVVPMEINRYLSLIKSQTYPNEWGRVTRGGASAAQHIEAEFGHVFKLVLIPIGEHPHGAHQKRLLGGSHLLHGCLPRPRRVLHTVRAQVHEIAQN